MQTANFYKWSSEITGKFKLFLPSVGSDGNRQGISIERITFDPEYWDNVLTKLTEFYDNCFALEIVSPLR